MIYTEGAPHSAVRQLDEQDLDRLYPEQFACHRRLSGFLDIWADQTDLEASNEHDEWEAAYMRGYSRALRDMAQHLREGDALPNGILAESLAS